MFKIYVMMYKTYDFLDLFNCISNTLPIEEIHEILNALSVLLSDQ